MGPTKSKIFLLSKFETSAKHATLGSCGIFSDKWWVIEWWVMSDEKWVMSDGVLKTKKLLSIL